MTFEAPNISCVLFVSCTNWSHKQRSEDDLSQKRSFLYGRLYLVLSPPWWRLDRGWLFLDPWNVKLIFVAVWIKNLMNSENFKAACVLLSMEWKRRLDNSWIDKILDNTDIHFNDPSGAREMINFFSHSYKTESPSFIFTELRGSKFRPPWKFHRKEKVQKYKITEIFIEI